MHANHDGLCVCIYKEIHNRGISYADHFSLLDVRTGKNVTIKMKKCVYY